MRIAFISDTHGQHWNYRLNQELNKIFDEDPETVLVHCGDISSRGRLVEVKDFIDWFDGLQFRHKIFIAGNHDFLFEDEPDVIQEILLDRGKTITYLNDSGIEIDGVKFWGSPVTPRFFNWAFNRDSDIVNHWAMIPTDTNVLITHGPPYGIFDVTQREFKNVGCNYLRTKLFDLKDLRIHSFGHIHEAHGHQIGDSNSRFEEKAFEEIHFINASYLDLRYQPVNHPVVVNI